MPPSASRNPSADFCHSAHNAWNRCCATPAQSLPSGANDPASARNSPSMLDDPELTRDDNPANCSGVTLMPLTATSCSRAVADCATQCAEIRPDDDCRAAVVHSGVRSSNAPDADGLAAV